MLELMRRQGYAATSVKEVAEAALAPTGSLYHYFPHGKQQIATAALRTSASAYAALIPLHFQPHEDLSDGLRSLFQAAAVDLRDSGWLTLCPVGSVASEVAGTDPNLRYVCGEVFSGWIDEASAYFVDRGVSPRSARSFVTAVLAGLEGAFVMARTLRTTEPLEVARDALTAYLESLTRAD